MTDYSDDFNRANGAPGANWTAINGGTWAIASNALTQTNVTGTYRGQRWAQAFAGNNLYARVAARAPSGTGFGVLVRCPTTGTALTDIDGYGLVLFVGDQRYRIEFLNGSDSANTGLGGTVTANTDYTIEIQADGSTITALVGGSQVAQWTDTTYSSGGVMLLTYGGTVTFDNFAAGDIAAAAVLIPVQFQPRSAAMAIDVWRAVGWADSIVSIFRRFRLRRRRICLSWWRRPMRERASGCTLSV